MIARTGLLVYHDANSISLIIGIPIFFASSAILILSDIPGEMTINSQSKTLYVCPKCDHHLRIGSRLRLEIFF